MHNIIYSLTDPSIKIQQEQLDLILIGTFITPSYSHTPKGKFVHCLFFKFSSSQDLHLFGSSHLGFGPGNL